MITTFKKHTTLFLVLLILISASGLNLFAYKAPAKKILILHSYHRGLSWTENISSGIESVLREAQAFGMKISIDYEYMDTKRFSTEEYYRRLIELYKYKKLTYDVIIAADDNALNFLLKNRDDLFGSVPVVFCGVNFFSKKGLKGKKFYTGVVEAFDVKATLDVAIRLHPETSNFIIIGDSTTTSVKDRIAVKKAEPEFRKKNITFTYLTNGDIKEYTRLLQKSEKGTVAIAMHLNRDSRGNFYTFEESFDIYTQNVMIPVYTFWDFYLGRGAMGGMIISGITQGEEAARKALKVLKGYSADDIPVLMESPNTYMFDYRVMEKYDISISDLPKGSVVINSPKSLADLYRENKAVIHGVLAFIIFLVGVIITLTLNILKRRRIEKELVRTNIAYDRFVPHKFLDYLGKENITDVMLGDNVQKEMTVLFSDIRSFTSLSEKMSPEENFNFLNSYLNLVGPIIRDNNGFIDKYIGDAVMAIFPDKPDDALRAAIDMQFQVIEYNLNRKKSGYDPIAIGIGLHTGNLMLGTIGEAERMEGTVISDAVNLASRLEGLTKTFGAAIIISRQMLDIIGESRVRYNYRSLGSVQVKGKNESVELFEVIDGNKNYTVKLKVQTMEMFEKGMEFFRSQEFEKSHEIFADILKVNPYDKAAIIYMKKSEMLIGKKLSSTWTSVLKFATK